MEEPTQPAAPPDRHTPRVSVLIVNYNSGAERLSRCLAALAQQSFGDFEIILVDNGSEDGSIAAQSFPDNLTLIEAGENLGFAGGMNRAAETARGKWLALVNPDTVARPGWLAALMAATGQHPGARLFGSVQIDANNQEKLDGIGDVYHLTGIAWRGGFGKTVHLAPVRDEEIFAPCGAACLYDADLFRRLGGFEESFFCYNEDVDFGFRARLSGEYSVLVAEAEILHEGSAVTGRRSGFTVYHGTRNRIWTFIRCMPSPAFWIVLPFHGIVNMLFLLRAIPLGVAGAYWRGMIDGFFKAGTAWSARKTIQAARTAPWRSVTEMMTVSLGKLILRAPDTRPLPQPAED